MVAIKDGVVLAHENVTDEEHPLFQVHLHHSAIAGGFGLLWELSGPFNPFGELEYGVFIFFGIGCSFCLCLGCCFLVLALSHGLA